MVPARPAQLEEPGPRGRGPLRARRRRTAGSRCGTRRPGEGFDFGRIKAWEPGKRLLLDYLIHDGGHDTEVEVRFEPTEGGTRVVLEHRGWDALPPAVAAAGVANVQKGEPVLLGWFAEYIEKEAR